MLGDGCFFHWNLDNAYIVCIIYVCLYIFIVNLYIYICTYVYLYISYIQRITCVVAFAGPDALGHVSFRLQWHQRPWRVQCLPCWDIAEGAAHTPYLVIGSGHLNHDLSPSKHSQSVIGSSVATCYCIVLCPTFVSIVRALWTKQ